MIRRAFLLSLAALAAAAPLSAQEPARFNAVALRRAFDALPQGRRVKVQEELITGGFYKGAPDGRYGPATEAALAAAAGFILFNSRAQVQLDLMTDQGTMAYLDGLASGTLAGYLYGEGDECDNC